MSMCLWEHVYNGCFLRPHAQLTILVFRHDGVTEGKKPEEHVNVRVAGLDSLPQAIVVETEVRLVHRVVRKVNSWCTLTATNGEAVSLALMKTENAENENNYSVKVNKKLFPSPKYRCPQPSTRCQIFCHIWSPEWLLAVRPYRMPSVHVDVINVQASLTNVVTAVVTIDLLNYLQHVGNLRLATHMKDDVITGVLSEIIIQSPVFISYHISYHTKDHKQAVHR